MPLGLYLGPSTGPKIENFGKMKKTPVDGSARVGKNTGVIKWRGN